MINILDELLLEVKQIPLLERDEWKWISHKFEIQKITRKAVMIGGCWIPLSQVRADHDSKLIYIARWFYQQNLRGKLR